MKAKSPFINFPSIKFRKGALAAMWVCIILGLVAFVNKRQEQRVCRKVNISIENEHNHFIDEVDIKELLSNNTKEVLENESHQFISLKELERRVAEHGFVEKVIICKDLKGSISIDVKPYKPIVRLSLGNGQGRYVSTSGKILPLLKRYTARVMVFDGSYNAILAMKSWNKDSLRSKYFEFVNNIYNDEFLSVMISSVSVNYKGEITIYPQIGKQVIDFGIPENQQLKFDMIRAFYKNIIPAKGWNRYSKLSLRFDNQLVCE